MNPNTKDKKENKKHKIEREKEYLIVKNQGQFSADKILD